MNDPAQSITAEEVAQVTRLPVAMFRRRAWDYHSSHAMQELVVELTDGTTISMLFKDLHPAHQLDEAKRTRPEFLYNARREIDVYLEVLAAADLDTPRCYGAVVDDNPESPRYWLLLEKIPAYPLRLSAWEFFPLAARWLSRLHAMHWMKLPASLLRYDQAYYWTWMNRAVEHCPELRLIAGRYGEIVRRLSALPATFIHGEFYASNVLVQDNRIRPVDWETAAIGPAMIDLAALCAGNMEDGRREELSRAYDGNLDGLDECRLHLAIQWLGWSKDWTPPKDQAQDWLAEAMMLAARLGIA